jgi:hypothetical protein
MIIDSPIISGSSSATGSLNQVGIVSITGSLFVNGLAVTGNTGSAESASYAGAYTLTSSFQNYTSSTDARIASINASTSSLNSYTSSTDAKIASINAFSASILNYTSSTDANITALYAFSSSLLSYTSSNNANITSLNSYTSSATARFVGLETATSSLNSFTSSANTRLGTLEAATASLNNYTSSATARFVGLETATSSLNAFTSSATARFIGLEAATSSLNTFTSSINSRVTVVESKYATTGSNTFTGCQYISNTTAPTGFSNTTAAVYTDGGLQVTKDSYFSSSLYIKGDLIVYGTQSVSYITSSALNISTNIISVNTATPSVRYGGLAVYDSGSTGLTGSLLWDSEDNQWIYSNPSGSTYDSAVFLVGPRNVGVLGNEPGISCNFLSKGNGLHHMTSSGIFEDGSRTCFYSNASITSAGTACFGGMTIVNSCLGIGTASPGAKLQVYGNMQIYAGSAGNSDPLVFGGEIGAPKKAIFLENFWMIYQGHDNEGHKFRSVNADGVCTDDMVITGGGSVGIGTSSPEATLHIAKAGNDDQLVLGSAATNRDIAMHMYSSTTKAEVLRFQSATNLLIGSSAAIGNLHFNPGGSLKMVVQSGGNVGIGTSNPDYKLDVNGTGRFTACSCVQENIIVKSANTGFSKINIDSVTGASSQLAFLENGTQKGVVGYRPSTCNVFLANATGDILTIASTGVASFSSTVTAQANNISADGAGVVLQGYVDNTLRIAARGSGYNDGARGNLLAKEGSFDGKLTVSQASTDFIAEFINTANSTPYGLRIKDAGTPANNYPLLSVTNNAGSVEYFRVNSGTGIATFSNTICVPVAIFSGCVGIGTTSPSSTYGTLTVAGTGLSIADDGNAKLQIGRYNGSVCNAYIKMGTNACSLRFTNAADTVDVVVMEKGGNVGIGTSSPGTALEISSTAASADRTIPHNVLTITALQGNAPYGFFGGSILFKNSSYVTGVVCSARIRSVIYDDGAPANCGGGLWFETTPTPGGSLTPSLKIDYRGQSTFNSSFYDVAAFNSTYGQSGISIQNNGTSFAVFGSGISVTSTAANDDVGIGTAGLAKSIVFATGTGYTERMRITSAGIACFSCTVCAPIGIFSTCVGINVTSPDAPLRIHGGAGSTSTVIIAGGAAGNDNATISAPYSMVFQVDNTGGVGGRSFSFKCGGKGYSDGTSLLAIGPTGNVTPGANGTQDLGSSSLRWCTVYTSDLSLNNGIGNYTIVEGENDLFLYNNNSCKVYKFMLQEVCPEIAPAKRSI